MLPYAAVCCRMQVVRHLLPTRVLSVACGWGCTLVLTEARGHTSHSSADALPEVPC
jgi:hypothetical protein